jgi:hypothetical protein
MRGKGSWHDWVWGKSCHPCWPCQLASGWYSSASYVSPQVKVNEYNTLKTALNAAMRKQGGSLSVRDISTLIKPGHIVDSENLTTLFVVVSKFGLQEWATCYEKLTSYVVRAGWGKHRWPLPALLTL